MQNLKQVWIFTVVYTIFRHTMGWLECRPIVWLFAVSGRYTMNDMISAY